MLKGALRAVKALKRIRASQPWHQPRYEFPRLPLVFEFGRDLLLGRRRSFARDGQRIMAANPYPRQVEGLENVPQEGSFILVMNHYNRRGLRPYHCAFAVSAILSQHRPAQPEVCWAFTSELEGQRLGPLPIPVSLTRWVMRRVGRVYNLVVLPRQEARVMGRAAALRRLVQALSRAAVGLTPEGAGSGRLIEPPRGSGLFLSALGSGRVPFLPLALWEEGATLMIRFGQPFHLSLPKTLSREEQDRLAREQVMVAIGRLLPREYWGAYSDILERSSEQPLAGGVQPRVWGGGSEGTVQAEEN